MSEANKEMTVREAIESGEWRLQLCQSATNSGGVGIVECMNKWEQRDGVKFFKAALAALRAQEQPKNMGEVSDGYHTFNELYHHRAVLFSVICNDRPNLAWKSKRHSDGTMFDGMFIVGIGTPNGQATYHYDIVPYWDAFNVPELDQAPEWDGHTPAQAIERIGALSREQNEPLTCEGCRRDGTDSAWCEGCTRNGYFGDNYEPKGAHQ